MTDEIKEGGSSGIEFEVEPPQSECYPCANGDLIFPDGVSAFCAAVGAILVRTIRKTSDIEVMDAKDFKWRTAHVPPKGTAKVATLK
jgi:hypothetical protein